MFVCIGFDQRRQPSARLMTLPFGAPWGRPASSSSTKMAVGRACERSGIGPGTLFCFSAAC